jgi:hypothetical protein
MIVDTNPAIPFFEQSSESKVFIAYARGQASRPGWCGQQSRAAAILITTSSASPASLIAIASALRLR